MIYTTIITAGFCLALLGMAVGLLITYFKEKKDAKL